MPVPPWQCDAQRDVFPTQEACRASEEAGPNAARACRKIAKIAKVHCSRTVHLLLHVCLLISCCMVPTCTDRCPSRLMLLPLSADYISCSRGARMVSAGCDTLGCLKCCATCCSMKADLLTMSICQNHMTLVLQYLLRPSSVDTMSDRLSGRTGTPPPQQVMVSRLWSAAVPGATLITN